MEKKADSNLYLLNFNKKPNKLRFIKEINSLEFVELINGMDLSYAVNYIKRDLYLKSIGKRLFKLFKQKKFKKNKTKIKINHDIKYFHDYISDKYSNETIEVLSQEEIDMMLTPVKDEDNKKK